MVDCADGVYGNLGCYGGLEFAAYLYTNDQPLELASDYPYVSGVT